MSLERRTQSRSLKEVNSGMVFSLETIDWQVAQMKKRIFKRIQSYGKFS